MFWSDIASVVVYQSMAAILVPEWAVSEREFFHMLLIFKDTHRWKIVLNNTKQLQQEFFSTSIGVSEINSIYCFSDYFWN